jgi:GTPase SAR1 family protein
LRGAAGYLLVADGTRGNTLETARMLERRVSETIGALPFVLLLNKADLTAEWEIDDQTMEGIRAQGWDMLKSSAKTGEGVEEAFQILARKVCS